jgi:hypothetical protein
MPYAALHDGQEMPAIRLVLCRGQVKAVAVPAHLDGHRLGRAGGRQLRRVFALARAADDGDRNIVVEGLCGPGHIEFSATMHGRVNSKFQKSSCQQSMEKGSLCSMMQR